MMIKPTILIADDDPNDRILYQLAFGKVAGFCTIQIVEGGQQAISYLFGERTYADRDLFPLPKAVILDLKMPGISGFDVLKSMRSAIQFCQIPVIVCTASDYEADIARAYELGASSYVLKPASLAELNQLVHDLARWWLIHNQVAELLEVENVHCRL